MNREKLGDKLVDDFLKEVKLFFIDDSHISEVSDEEQTELEQILSSMTTEDNNPALVRKISCR